MCIFKILVNKNDYFLTILLKNKMSRHNSDSEKEIVIFNAPRDKTFIDMLNRVLKRAKIKDEYISKILDKGGFDLYSQAFTHPTANENVNYETLEILGDSIVNCCIVWYLSRRFPQLNCPQGVKIIARLKINLVSKKMFAEFGKNLGLWDFVSADDETRSLRMKKTLEDVFEAFFGATQKLVDENIRMGVGYSICYDLIKSLFDEIDISLKYEDLYDAKTRLKETFDQYGKNIVDGETGKVTRYGIGQMKWENERIEKIQYVQVYRIQQNNPKKKILIGKGSAALKPDAQQKAAEVALKTLARQGYVKDVDEFYKTLC